MEKSKCTDNTKEDGDKVCAYTKLRRSKRQQDSNDRDNITEHEVNVPLLPNLQNTQQTGSKRKRQCTDDGIRGQNVDVVNKLQLLTSGITTTKIPLFNPKTVIVAESLAGSSKDDVLSNKTDIAAFSEMTAHHIVDINVKTEENTPACRVSSMVVLPGNKLFVIDSKNAQIKVVDTVENVIVSELKIDGTPTDACKWSEHSLAVTDFAKQRVMIVGMEGNDQLYLESSISVDGNCLGIAVTDDRMYVTFQFPHCLKIMDRKGEVIKSINMDCSGLDIPQYVTLGSDKQSLYVSHSFGSRVVRLDMDGTVKAAYMDKDLSLVHQIATDARGVLYITGYASSNIHVVTSDCMSKVKVILSAKDGLKDVVSVCYCEATQKLYVGMYNCIIKAFRIE